MPTPFEDLGIREKSLLSEIYAKGKIQRKDLKKKADIKIGTYYNSIETLLQLGMVRKENEGSTGKGRPSEVLYFNERYTFILHLFISKSSYSFAVLDLNGKVLEEESYSFDRNTTYDEIHDGALAFHARWNATYPLSYMTYVSGINRRGQSNVLVHSSLRDNNPGKNLSQELGLTLVTETISRSVAVSLSKESGEEERKSFIFLNLSSGIGLGIVEKGQLIDTLKNPGIDHYLIRKDGRRCICGRRGCVVTYVGTANIVQNVKRELSVGLDSLLSVKERELKIADVIEAAKNGDSLAEETFQEVAEVLLHLLQNLQCIFPVSQFILGGTLVKGNTYLKGLLKEMEEEIPLRFEEDYLSRIPEGISHTLMKTILSTEKGVIKEG